MAAATQEKTGVTITDAQKQQFQDEGYFVLEAVVPADHLQAMRDECQRFMDDMDALMEEKGVDKVGLNHKGSRYFLSAVYHKSEKLRRFLFSPVMADICRATLGDEVTLFNDQYVVKAAEKGGKFSWHQDGGYIPYEHTPYLTCWVALDDVNEENGTVYLLPYSRQGTRGYLPHVKDPETNDMVGYFGDDPGLPLIVPAGSIACFSSTVLHRSGPNTTDRMRRVYLCQYSAGPILNAEGTGPRHEDTPFVVNGKVVAVQD